MPTDFVQNDAFIADAGNVPSVDLPTDSTTSNGDKTIVWLTGPPCAGKTTLARAVHAALAANGRLVEVIDGDEIRQILSPDLGYSPEQRNANVRRIAHVARLLARHGVLVLVAAVSPYIASRREAKSIAVMDNVRFLEVHVHAPRDVLIRRDVKGMYKRALEGKIKAFTGVTAPYEPPAEPDLVIHTDSETLQQSRDRILALLQH